MSISVESSLPMAAQADMSNDVCKAENASNIKATEVKCSSVANTVTTNGQPEDKTASACVETKVSAAVEETVNSNVPVTKTATKSAEQPSGAVGSQSPVKRKPDSDKSDTEVQSPSKKLKSLPEEHSSKAKPSVTSSDDDSDDEAGDSTDKKSPRKRAIRKEHYVDEELQPGLLELPVVIEDGTKREKKKVQRLEVAPGSVGKQKRLSVEEGAGTKLGDIPYIEFQLQKTHVDDLKPFHRLLFDRIVSIVEIKKNIRRFSGFPFTKDSAEMKKKSEKLSKYTNPMLKSICEILDVERKGKKEEIVERIMDYLCEPRNTGKLPSSAMKRRHSSQSKRRSSSKGTPKEKKPRVKKEKSKDDDKPLKDSDAESDVDAQDRKSSSESEVEEKKSDDSPAKKEKKKKKKPKAETSTKKTPVKKSPGKKSPVKKTPKSATKSSSAKKTKKTKVLKELSSDDDSDDDNDKPLSKKKSPPTNAMLKDVVKKILKTANLEEITMKTVCKQVYDKFPDFDLTSRKEFIKSTVKQILK